jgi:hypothetical protein
VRVHDLFLGFGAPKEAPTIGYSKRACSLPIYKDNVHEIMYRNASKSWRGMIWLLFDMSTSYLAIPTITGDSVLPLATA